jgi:hypothetical protein
LPRKTYNSFWQKHSPNCDILSFHSPSTLSTPKYI